jgi:desulfoferrodoxin-like iron-binding protein
MELFLAGMPRPPLSGKVYTLSRVRYSMTEVSEVYLCEICGNKVKVLENGVGTLVCCGEPMVKVE